MAELAQGTNRPQFSWKRNLWKGVRPALIAGGVAFVTAIAPDPGALQDYGIPVALSVFIWESGRNWLKQHGYIKQ